MININFFDNKQFCNSLFEQRVGRHLSYLYYEAITNNSFRHIMKRLTQGQ